MFSVAAPQARGKSAQDNIFAANNRAVALADKIGKDKVINEIGRASCRERV